MNVLFISLDDQGYHANIALECFESSNFSISHEKNSLPFVHEVLSLHEGEREERDKILLKEPKLQNCISVLDDLAH